MDVGEGSSILGKSREAEKMTGTWTWLLVFPDVPMTSKRALGGKGGKERRQDFTSATMKWEFF